jgi:hypothetical protein
MIEGHTGLCRHVDLVERNPLLVPACSSEKTFPKKNTSIIIP